ncbi:MAG: hypothetical protein ABR566_01755 [Pyrinomonadaceae bacterium]
MQEIILACDLNSTNLWMAAVSSDGKILRRLKIGTPSLKNF